MRSNINMAMVCMVNKTAVDALSGVSHSPVSVDKNLSVINQNERYDECEVEGSQLLQLRGKASGRQYVRDLNVYVHLLLCIYLERELGHL